ncbi:MAG: hypothetical protein WCA08_24900 [Desulfoferrobacter sp.]
MYEKLATIEQIQKAILSLPGHERTSLLDWLLKMDDLIWDKEIERDFSAGGPGTLLLDRIKKDFKAGRCRKWE